MISVPNIQAIWALWQEEQRRIGRTALVYDQRHLLGPGLRGKTKWYTDGRQLQEKTRVCIHHTGNKRGAGPRRKAIRQYKAAHQETPWEAHPGKFVLPTSGIRLRNYVLEDEYFRMLAVFDRMRGVPLDKWNTGMAYHALTSYSSDLVFNLPFSWWTWHGNDANRRSIGYAIDADLRDREQQMNFRDIDLQWDLKYLIEEARQEGHPIDTIEFHCQYTNKPDDPGAWYIANVVRPVVAQDDNLQVLWDWKQKPSFKTPNEVLREAA